MLDDLWKAVESLSSSGVEMHESTADIIQIRPESVGESVHEIGIAITAMLGGVQERTDRVGVMSDKANGILSPSIVELEQASTFNSMVAGSPTEELRMEDNDMTIARIDKMLEDTRQEDEVERARQAVVDARAGTYEVLKSDPKPASLMPQSVAQVSEPVSEHTVDTELQKKLEEIRLKIDGLSDEQFAIAA